MKIYIKGKGEVSLDQSDFIASGGEGSVYAKSGTAYKIYTDSKNMIPLGKIQELSQLTDKHIIKPEDVLCDKNGKIIGYTMKYVKDTYALCQIFTKAFRQRNNISPDMSFDLVKNIQEIMKHCHEHQIICVDFNEMNILVNNSFDEVYLIDTDSVQTPSFPATAIMDTIRDRHSKPNDFNEGTDWFAFGIVSFMTLIGIHPYKGKHPTIKDIDTRMVKNISVFHKDVSIPNVCYDFSVIPKNYLNWYKALFDDGKRLAPPTEGEIVQIIQQVKTIVGSNKFVILKLFKTMKEITRYIHAYNLEICLTADDIFINKKSTGTKPVGVLAITPKTNKVIMAELDFGKLRLHDVVANKELSFVADADSLMEYDNRIYFKNGMNVCEIKFAELGTNIIPSTKIVGKVMPNAVLHTYGGVIIQDLLGTYYTSVFPQPDTCYQIKMDVLNGYKIVEAKFESKVLMVIAAKSGRYDRFIFRFNDAYSEYDMRQVANVQYSGSNFVVLDNGICVHITEDETLELFSNKKDSTGLKVIDDPIIKGDMVLSKNGQTTIFTQGNAVYSLKMK